MNYMQNAALGNGMNYATTALGGPRNQFVNNAEAMLPNGFAGYTDDLIGYGLDDGGDQGDSKRRRIARV